MTATKPGDALAAIIETLSPLEPESRHRTLAAAVAYCDIQSVPGRRDPSTYAPAPDGVPASGAIANLSAKAVTWMKQNNVSSDEIERVFHISEGSAEVIAGTIPGKSKKEQTFNAYILLGLAKFLVSGTPYFEDKEARALCITQGCYDAPNHATNFKDKGNELAGSKEKGWTVTAPGLKSGANLVKELAKGG